MFIYTYKDICIYMYNHLKFYINIDVEKNIDIWIIKYFSPLTEQNSTYAFFCLLSGSITKYLYN